MIQSQAPYRLASPQRLSPRIAVLVPEILASQVTHHKSGQVTIRWVT
jgi:hypothetical protein